MKIYLKLLKKILKNGQIKKNRTGINTLSIFGHQIKINLNNQFPLITTKKCNISAIIYELLWFLKGDTNIKYLNKKKINIWNQWANKNGDLGPIYGAQWRKWKTINKKKIDQIQSAIDLLKKDPNSRRIIVSSWNPGDIKKMSLPPCHILFQFYVINNTLSCQIYQRSCDVFLGLPFNIASYAILINMFAQQCNFNLGELIWTGGDVHLYINHLSQAKEQLKRIPKKLPLLKIVKKRKSIFDYKFKDFKIENYKPYSSIKAEIAI
ncbi:Thymidylate synthase [Buchnera aphidicola (Chaitophorus populicola)]|uniref:thymidylate synthase n=1 Tax=Buchnera aphidicola TaxID=9 RepID=UPI003464B85D